MYGGYILLAVVQIAIERGWHFLPQSDYAAMMVGVAGEWFLFTWHFDRGPLEIMLHECAKLILQAKFLSHLLELFRRADPLAAVFRGYCFLLQATWFFQTGWIVLPPWQTTWESENHLHVVLVTVAFVLHLVLDAAFVFALNIVVARVQQRRYERLKFHVDGSPTIVTERASKKSKPRGMSYYQKLRKRNIAEKMALLASLGVSTDIKTLHEQVSKKRHLKR
ncbi:unnamed protein product [Darwinula stevensoni]|uniref:Uncharacterized protein n=1 Tax=Darwinula stevensoni TaxID=69355 RepID=A0A7R9A641_9CRUS|nr:unnamed protein product [Darwinula stevensoni]CAG0895873.1 unnamed protein product [Darwinula stevensoni]